MKRLGCMLVLFTLVASIAAAQVPATKSGTSETALPTIDQVLDKYVAATGGKDALAKITSRQAKGTFELAAMGVTGSVTVLSKAPNRAASITDIAGFGAFRTGFDGTVAWSDNPMTGLTELGGDALAAAKRDAIFNGEFKLKEIFEKLVVTGKQKVDEKDVFVVEATPAGGKAETFFFDTESGLLVRHDAERSSDQGVTLVETHYGDYRAVDGVKVPFSIKQVTPQMTIAITLTEVTHNVAMEDAKFAKPAAR
jgi:hypothetical protein